MKPNDYAKLEKDYSFKMSYLKNTQWWKTILMLPPVCFLFVGLIGILYLFNNDMLVSWYIIPYLIFFVIGTIWLKTMKKHLQKTMMATEGSFHICLAKPIGEKGGYVYTVFANNSRRHDKYNIINLAKELSLDDILDKHKESFKKKSILIHNEDNDSDFFIRAFFNNDLTKRNPDWREDNLFPVLYINDKDTFIVKKKDLI
ncbi:hypothetical protein JGH11_06470 [Dysgonomonas sp. Marseille-P4677]|uniref:hypothetical protein n=1 Tax=Dysgonomonas sp. Marseille-P4677 TaxID=2364790 RepID=UPI001912BE8C|nr:hypothetical protein [Dysgonomonas sp. Marseille-P4677]MBK5720511.1 hypothetical protein [Dysgonomonas sp. Marseille-P4677]